MMYGMIKLVPGVLKLFWSKHCSLADDHQTFVVEVCSHRTDAPKVLSREQLGREWKDRKTTASNVFVYRLPNSAIVAIHQ